MTQEETRFWIGDVPILGDLILAPMDGISLIPFREMCRRFGSAISYTPFVRAKDLIDDTPRAWEQLTFVPEERSIAFQIYGESEENLIEAARRISRLKPDIIDVNMGCPIRKIANRGAGAGLLRDPAKIGRILSALSTQIPIPITAKIRLGWDEQERNYLEVGHAIEENGGTMIAVHARTRSQGYRHEADWEAIAEIKHSLNIPVVGNGDVNTPVDADRMLAQTGCDAVMIGRAAVGNPWIFRRVDARELPSAEVSAVIAEHLERMLMVYGSPQGILLFRRHLSRYLELFDFSEDMRMNLLTTTDPDMLRSTFQDIALFSGRQDDGAPGFASPNQGVAQMYNQPSAQSKGVWDSGPSS